MTVPSQVVNGVLYGEDARVAAWMQPYLGTDSIVDVPFTALGIVGKGQGDKDTLIGGVYFFNEQEGRDIMFACVIDDPNALPRATVRQLLAYPFLQRKLGRLSAEIEAQNMTSIEQAMKLGMRMEGRKRRAGKDGDDVLMFGLLKEECPFWEADAR